MNVFDAIIKRRSVRSYQSKPVDDKLIGVILWAGAQAPSAGNLKDWRFIVVKNQERKNKLYEACFKQDHVKQAPVDIVVAVDVEAQSLKYGKRGELVYSLEDASAAIENMLLAATALGLATCWVGAMDEEAVRHVVGLPDFVRPVAIITLGYPAEEVEEKKIDYTRFCYLETYGNKFKFEFKTLEELLRKAINKMKKS